jgi:hypothetical protein
VAQVGTVAQPGRPIQGHVLPRSAAVIWAALAHQAPFVADQGEGACRIARFKACQELKTGRERAHLGRSRRLLDRYLSGRIRSAWLSVQGGAQILKNGGLLGARRYPVEHRFGIAQLVGHAALGIANVVKAGACVEQVAVNGRFEQGSLGAEASGRVRLAQRDGKLGRVRQRCVIMSVCNAKDPSPLKVKEVWIEKRRYVVCLNEEERRKDAHDREAIVAHLKEQLRRGDKSLVGNKGYRRYLKVEGESHFALDEKRIKAEARYDGIWVLRTNTDYNAETVAHVYKNLWTVEDIFRTTKSILETRPIYHKRDETIRGHVFCSFLALLLKQELESRMKRAELHWEWAEVIRGLDNLQQVEANFQGRRFLFRSQLTAHASQAVRATGVALPATLREIQ